MSSLLQIFSLTCIALVNVVWTNGYEEAKAFLLMVDARLETMNTSPTVGELISLAGFVAAYNNREFFKDQFKAECVEVCTMTPKQEMHPALNRPCQAIFGSSMFTNLVVPDHIIAETRRALAFLILVGEEALVFHKRTSVLSQVLKEPAAPKEQAWAYLPISSVLSVCQEAKELKKEKLEEIAKMIATWQHGGQLKQEDHLIEEACKHIMRQSRRSRA